LIEEYSCSSKDAKNAREGHYIKPLNCVNKKVEGRTREEYRIDNKESIQQYYQDNKDKILEYRKEYKEKKIPIPGRLDNTSGKELFSLDDQFKFGELTKDDPKASGFELEIQQNWTPFAE
jgi:hypothetical protein